MFSQARIKRLLAAILLLCFIAPAFAGDITVPTFTNEDLNKYKSREKSAPESQRPVKENKKEQAKRESTKCEVPYEPGTTGAKRIIIPVTINNSLTVPMALDTGSTGMIISIALAGKLGLFKKDEGRLLSEVKGIGGKDVAIITVIDTVQVGKAKDEFIPTTVTLTPFTGEGFEGLVGMDFMTKYSVQIDAKKHVLVFGELSPQENMPGGHDEEWWRNTFYQFASIRSEWKRLRDYLNKLQGNTVTSAETGIIHDISELRPFANRQYKEADKLMNKLHNYAVEHIVPMEWREY